MGKPLVVHDLWHSLFGSCLLLALYSEVQEPGLELREAKAVKPRPKPPNEQFGGMLRLTAPWPGKHLLCMMCMLQERFL